jgi:hypothetical protein
MRILPQAETIIISKNKTCSISSKTIINFRQKPKQHLQPVKLAFASQPYLAR